jgi:hypothetical protein
VVRSRILTPDKGPGMVLLRLFRLDSGGADEFTAVVEPVAVVFGAYCDHERTTRLGFSSYGGE